MRKITDWKDIPESWQHASFKKRPVIVHAWVAMEECSIETLEGTMKANKGDYIIQGVNNEMYPCKPDIFTKTYEHYRE